MESASNQTYMTCFGSSGTGMPLVRVRVRVRIRVGVRVRIRVRLRVRVRLRLRVRVRVRVRVRLVQLEAHVAQVGVAERAVRVAAQPPLEELLRLLGRYRVAACCGTGLQPAHLRLRQGAHGVAVIRLQPPLQARSRLPQLRLRRLGQQQEAVAALVEPRHVLHLG